MHTLHAQTLFQRDGLVVRDVRCRHPEPHCGKEEECRVHQVVFIRSGVFVRHARGHELIAEPNQALFYNRGDTHRVSHPTGQGDDCFVLIFPEEWVRDAVAEFDPSVEGRPGSPFRHGRGTVSPFMQRDYHDLRRGLRDGSIAASEAQERALSLLHAILGSAYRRDRAVERRLGRTAARRRKELVQGVLLALAARPHAGHSLAALAGQVGCSPYHLVRIFRAELGTPVHQYQLRLRLATALERVAEGESHLSSLAFELGFSSHSHLSTQFRKTFGMSPSEFRFAPRGRRADVEATARAAPQESFGQAGW